MREVPFLVGPYSQSVRIGSVVAAAGQVGIDPKPERIVGDVVTSQTYQALKYLGAALRWATACG